MPEIIVVLVGGKRIEVRQGTSAAVAALMSGALCRTSASGQPRAPLCGMGICFECRMRISGKAHARSCQVLCFPGMEIEPDE
jgi:sarcosine oxidase subunit alpha